MNKNTFELVTLLNSISLVSAKLAKSKSSSYYQLMSNRAKVIAYCKENDIDEITMLLLMYNKGLLNNKELLTCLHNR